MNPSGLAVRHTTYRFRSALLPAAIVILLVAMALDTKVVRISDVNGARNAAPSAAEFGRSTFPKVRSAVEARAVDAVDLAAAIGKNKDAAGEKYGIEAGAGPEMAVRFTGTVGKEDFGFYDVAVPGLPGSTLVRVQTGPAINGTDLRDSTGLIKFGQFTNQIEYQNAGSALNKEMKKQVLAKVDTGKLAGKTIAVVGVFQLIDPNSWLVTPVKLDVQ